VEKCKGQAPGLQLDRLPARLFPDSTPDPGQNAEKLCQKYEVLVPDSCTLPGDSLMRLRSILFLCLLISLAAGTARADSTGVVATYDVTGTLTITGNNVCSGPCVESVNFAFQMNYSYDSADGVYLGMSPGTTILSYSGPLGPFTAAAPCCSGMLYGRGADDLTTAQGDIIDFYTTWDATQPGPPTPMYSDFFMCSSATCITDFSPNGQSVANGVIGTVAFNTQLVSTPEPSTVVMLVAGFLGFICLATLRKRVRLTANQI